MKKSFCKVSRFVFFSKRPRFGIFKPFTNIQLPRRFDLGYLETPKQDYKYSNMGRKFLKSFKFSLVFPEK